MKIRYLYQKKEASKYNLKYEYDKTSKGRPAWIYFKNGLPTGTGYLSVHLGKIGKQGKRIQSYKRYLPEELFLPSDYTKEEMEKFYDKFSSFYDKELIKANHNIKAGKFLLGKLKKYVKRGSMLDLGAGTGLVTEIFVKQGFNPVTLVDYSSGMLKKAKMNKNLKGSKFIKADIRKLNLNKKYDVVISTFSFGGSGYFNLEELPNILNVAKKHLKKNGIICVLGHFGEGLFEKDFKTLDKGIYTLNKEKKFYVDYFIGRKK
jgi:ubiquinone/menaquinone biosynthesis C-methylase UbiE